LAGIVSFSSVKSQEAKIVFVMLIAIVMTSLAVTAFIEGIKVQFNEGSLGALKYYFAAVLSVAVIYWTQLKLKAMLRAI